MPVRLHAVVLLASAGWLQAAASAQLQQRPTTGTTPTPPHDDPAAPAAAAKVVYVAPNASEASGDGSPANPFTLAAAARSLRGKAAGATVLLRGGDYVLREPFVLSGAADGGAAGSPVTYASHPGERARLLGGIEVPAEAFHPAAGHPQTPGLLVADLRALGITNRSALGADGGGMGDLKAELFASDGDGLLEPLQMAQDPNPFPNGSWVYAGFSEILAANT